MIFNAKTSISRASDNMVYLTVADGASGVQLVEVVMTPHDFAMMITGLSAVKGIGTTNAKAVAVVGMDKETLGVGVPTGKEIVSRAGYLKADDKAGKKALEAELHAAILAAVPADKGEGWKIWSDGLRTQQNATQWQASVYRYVPRPDETLNPCPCGAQPTAADIHSDGLGGFFVDCPRCVIASSRIDCKSRAAAAERWNAHHFAGIDDPLED